MSAYVIRGGRPLFGVVEAQGSKNSAVAVLLACVAVRGEVVLHRVPFITDVTDCIEILRYLGGRVEWISKCSLSVNCSGVEYREVPIELTGRIRASTYLMGACLNRFGRCRLMRGGGCSLGERPVNLHIESLLALGASMGMDGELSTDGALNGRYVFPFVTVGGTVNAVVSTACGSGTCLLENCAREPHVCDVIRFLNACGADIRGVGTSFLTVSGVEKLVGCEYTLSGDMIEAGTYLAMGVATGGAVTVNGVSSYELESFCRTLSEMGVEISVTPDSVAASGVVKRSGRVETGAFPLFPTDLHPQTVAVMGGSFCESVLREKVFGVDRFKYLFQLERQGLKYRVEDDAVWVSGGGYRPAVVCATDLRGGVANVIAALCADGESVVRKAEYIERGYSDFVLKLRSLGAGICYSDE